MGVPVIDIAAFLDGSDLEGVARAVARACEEIGFLTIVGHGVDAGVIERMRAVSRAFFDQDMAVKERVRRANLDHARGYFRYGEVALAKSLGVQTPPDLKEVFSMGPPVAPAGVAGEAATIHFGPNLWPMEMPEVRVAFTAYFEALSMLASEVMEIFALGLGMDRRFFADKIDHAPSSLAAVNYPEQAVAPLPGQIRAGAHSDYGTLTILLSENRPGGLQVRDRAGAWVDVVTRPDSFVVNIGDLMMQWTNDRWISTVHRVVNPPPDALGSRRQSIVFFHNANHDALVECIPTCRGSGTPRHAAVLAGEHRLAKFRRANRLPVIEKAGA
jgi:isopenicillin N synthase-like dioxygenase